MRIDQFIYIVEISRLKSISLAAEQLHVSQPTISQAINALEVELGKKLFSRSRLGTTPTEYGKEIIEKAKEIINLIEEIKESADDSSKLLTGDLTINGVPGFCMSILPQVLVPFKKKFPGITLKIFEGGSLDIEKSMMINKIDLGFVAVSDAQHFDSNDELLFEQLTSGKILACVGQKSPLANKKSLTLNEIVDHPLVSPKPGYQIYDTIMDSLAKYGEPNMLFYSGNSAAGKQTLAEGIGVGFCSSITIRNDPYFTFEKLVALPISDEDLNLYYGYLKLKDKHFSRAAKEFIKVLKANID